MADNEKKPGKENEFDWLAEEKRQKREKDRKKFKSLSFGGKLQYIWDYHKAVLIFILALIVTVYEGVGIIQRANTKTLLYVAMMNTSFGPDEAGFLQKGFEEELGAGKWETVEFDYSIVVNPDNELDQSNMAAQIKMIAMHDTGDLDVIVFPAYLLDWLLNQGALMEMEDVLDKDTIASLGLSEVRAYEREVGKPDENGDVEITENKEKEHLYALNFGKNSILAETGFYFGDSDIYIGFGYDNGRIDTAVRFIEYLNDLDVSDIPVE